MRAKQFLKDLHTAAEEKMHNGEHGTGLRVVPMTLLEIFTDLVPTGVTGILRKLYGSKRKNSPQVRGRRRASKSISPTSQVGLLDLCVSGHSQDVPWFTFLLRTTLTE